MTVYKVEPTGKALGDTEKAFLWIHGEAPDAAIRWYEGLLEAFESLADNPRRCGFAPENSFFNEEIRQLLYGRYRILFTIVRKTVLVLRVWHGSREYLTPESE